MALIICKGLKQLWLSVKVKINGQVLTVWTSVSFKPETQCWAAWASK